jgi:pimeloyl-ACP methyl ester carboxylesterase
MGNLILSFLSRDWAGLPVAAVVALLGAGCLRAGRTGDATWTVVFGTALLAIAGLLALGSAWHLVHMALVRRRNPPPGRLVDVGGYRLHVVAEGENRGKPSVVWMPGGHAGGFALHHLHRALREEARSILVDRPGTGWSETGPFPRTTTREAEEVLAALDAAGERGPFVLVGHSFGGLLVANMARRRPESLAGLVLLDPTPPDTIIYGPPLPSLFRMRYGAVLNALPRLFGFHVDLADKRMRKSAPPVFRKVLDLVDERLGDAGRAMKAVDCGTRGACTGASIFSELTPAGLARVGWETAVYDGDLGELPVVLVNPADMAEQELDYVVKTVERQTGKRVDVDRLRRFYAGSMGRYLSCSSRTERARASAGSGHNFPYVEPELVVGVVRKLLTPGASEPAGPADPGRAEGTAS